jgi:pimeloyl-ACP methyl ester carboxylesterase
MRESRFTTSAGHRLNVASWEGDGPPVVLLHGVTRRWQDWLSIVPFLTPRWQVHALDFRGHGASDRTPGGYRVADYVPDVIDFLRDEIQEPAIVIGHSLGGNVAASVAAVASELVKGVVLEDPPLEMAGNRINETPFLETFRVFIQHAGSDRPVSEIANVMAESVVKLPNLAEPKRLGALRDTVSLRSSAAGLKRLDREVLEIPIAGQWLDGGDVRRDLQSIRCPALLLQADFAAGGALPNDHASEMAALLSDGVHIRLPGLGHNLHGMSTEVFLRLLLPFLGSLE